MSQALPYLDVSPDVRGKVTVYHPTTGIPIGYAVIQGATPGNATHRGWNGDPLLVRAWVRGANPRTTPQQARRAIHAAAVAAWQADPATCRAIARDEARARNIGDFMAWCAIYHRAHAETSVLQWDRSESPWDESATPWDSADSPWDDGASTWDAGATTWDHTEPSTWDNATSRWDYIAPSVWDHGVTHWDYTAASLWDGGASLWQD